MPAATNSFDCVILHCKPFFEADRLLTVFSEHSGKIKILAARANSKSSPFSGLLDTGLVVTMSTRDGKSFSYLNQCRLVSDFPSIRKSYNRIAMMNHFFELVMKATAFEQPNPDLFQVLIDGLQQLNNTDYLPQIQHDFYTQFLMAEGLLASDASTISITRFLEAFHSYTGHQITLPSLIHDE